LILIKNRRVKPRVFFNEKVKFNRKIIPETAINRGIETEAD